MTDIFISYAKEDRERAKALAETLQRLGWTVWWDRTIPAGKIFSEVIERAIADARCMVVVWSHYSVESTWVQEEAGEGKKRKILIPVLSEDVEPPLGFRSMQAADLTHWDDQEMGQEFEKFVEDISLVIGCPPKSVDEERQQAAAEAKRKAKEERQQAAAEAKRKAKEERQQPAAEAKRKAEEELQLAEDEAKHKAEEERRRAEKTKLLIIGMILIVVAVVAIVFLYVKNKDNGTIVTVVAEPTPTPNEATVPGPTPTPNKTSVIEAVVREYYTAVQNKDIGRAINMYASERIPSIKRERIAAVATDTEYYRIERINVSVPIDKRPRADIVLYHKKYGKPEETWEITITLVRENDSWKIWDTPGKRIQ